MLSQYNSYNSNTQTLRNELKEEMRTHEKDITDIIMKEVDKITSNYDKSNQETQIIGTKFDEYKKMIDKKVNQLDTDSKSTSQTMALTFVKAMEVTKNMSNFE